MQQTSTSNSTKCSIVAKQEQVEWLPEEQTILVRNIDPSFNYLLVTNSLTLTFSHHIDAQQCSQCHTSHPFLVYKSKSKENSGMDQKDAASFKYSILVLNKQGLLMRMLGTTKKDQFYVGNFVAKPKTISSEKKKKQPEIDLEPQIEQQQQEQGIRTRKRMATSVVDLLEHTSTSKGGLQQNCQLFVTKLQGEVRQFNQCNLFHEYVWTEEEIQFLMREVKNFFGDYQQVIQKRKYLKFTFKRPVADQVFWQKWHRTGGDILFRKQAIVEDKTLNYYVLSKQCFLSQQEQSTKLFQLPGHTPIIDFCIKEPWIIIAGQNYLLFLHNYRSMELFKHISKVKPTKISLIQQQSVVVLLNRDGVINCYQMKRDKVELVKTLQIPFVRPYCLAQIDKHVFIAGIDMEGKGDQRTESLHRKIQRLPFSISQEIHSKQIKIQPDRYIDVATLTKDKKNHPISFLTLINRQLLACSCLQIFYLFNLDGQKLTEVQLKAPISYLQFAPFPFNLFNFVIITNRGDLIKIGIEACGQTLGSQLQRLVSDEVRGCSLATQSGVKYSLLVLEGNQINQLSYLKFDKECLVAEKEHRIVSLASDHNGLAYLVDLENFYELKYLEF